jgi:hypothetical protein
VAQYSGYQRIVSANKLWVKLKRRTPVHTTFGYWLDACYSVIIEYTDRPNLARYQQIAARLHVLRGDLPAAHTAITLAIDLFERLGMRRELTEARAALADLEARERAESAG